MKKFILGTLFCIATSILLIAFFYPDIKITITEDQVKEQVDKKLPYNQDIIIEKEILSKMISETLHLDVYDASLKFLEDGRVSLFADFKVSRKSDSVKGSAVLISGIKFNNSEGSFYLNSTELKEYTLEPFISEETNVAVSTKLEDIKEKAISKKNKLKSFLKNNLSDELNAKVSVKATEYKKKAIEHIDNNKEVYMDKVKELVKDSLVKLTNKYPVYTLNQADIKQKVASMALKDIKFQEQEMIVVFSIAKFLSSLLLYCIAGGLYVLFVIGLMRNPDALQSLASRL